MSESGQIIYSPELALAVNKFGQRLISADAPELWTILTQIAHTGLSCYQWEYLAQLLAQKIDENSLLTLITTVLKRLLVLQTSSPIPDFTEVKSRLNRLLLELPGPPFTLQRLCELVVSPEKWGYTTTKRYVHAVEKVLSVTSYQDTLSPEQYGLALQEQFENMRAVKESRRAGEEDMVVANAEMNEGSNQASNAGFMVMGAESGENGAVNSESSGDQAQSSELEPHTDTPALISEEVDFSSPPEIETPNPSAMDVDT